MASCPVQHCDRILSLELESSSSRSQCPCPSADRSITLSPSPCSSSFNRDSFCERPNLLTPSIMGSGKTVSATIAWKTKALYILPDGLALPPLPRPPSLATSRSAGCPSFSSFITTIKTAPNSWPPIQQIVELTSGLAGNVISTRYSNVTGSRLNELAPNTALMRYGATSVRVCGAHINAR